MKFIKKNIIAIFSITLLVSYTIFGIFWYYKYYNPRGGKISYEVFCLNFEDMSKESQEFYKKHEEEIKNYHAKSCEENSKYEHLTDDTYTIFYQILVCYDMTYPLIYIMPIFLIIPAIWQAQKKISNNYAKNYLTRSNYKSYIKEIKKSVYKYAWILPVYLIIIFFVSYMISGHFDYSYAVDHSIATYSLDKLQMGGFFIAGLIINVFFHSLFYCNLALICVRRNKNIIVTLLETILLWYGIEIISELIAGLLIYIGVLKPEISLIFSFLNIYNLNETPNIIYVILMGICLFILSSIVVKILYKNKEKNIICWEK